jgi:hypothetical protein
MTTNIHYTRRCSKLLLMAALFCWLGLHCAAQASQPVPVPGAPPPPNPTEDSWEIQQRKAALKKFNLQRQQEIKKDAEKILELATALKQSVDKSNENTLSLDVIKEADQIEKLAKSVKDKMKGP